MKKFTFGFKLLLVFFCMTMVNAQAQNSVERYDLLLKFGNVNVTENVEQYSAAFNIGDQELVNGNYYKIIQFFQLPTNAEKSILEDMGIEFLDYIPNRAYTVSIPGSFELSSLKDFDVRSIVDIQPEFKQDPYILDQNYPEWALRGNDQIEIMVTFYGDLPYSEATSGISAYALSVIQNTPEATGL